MFELDKCDKEEQAYSLENYKFLEIGKKGSAIGQALPMERTLGVQLCIE